MTIESALRLAVLATSGLVLLLFLVSYWAGTRNKARGGLIAVAAVVTLVALGVTASYYRTIGPLLLAEGALLAIAVDLAVATGLVGGALQRRGGRPAALIAGGLALMALDLGVFYSQNHRVAEILDDLKIGVRHPKYAPTANLDCPENLKKLYIAFAQYAEGNDSLPAAEKWMDNDELVSKVQKDEWLHCPEVSNRHDDKFGYAYNDAVAGKKLNGKKLNAMPNASTTPLLYDSTNLAKSAHDPFATLPKPGRHAGRNNILYCDGHVETVEPK